MHLVTPETGVCLGGPGVGLQGEVRVYCGRSNAYHKLHIFKQHRHDPKHLEA